MLTRAFFNRPTLEVARDLLATHLCRRLAPRKILRYPIVEVEAYDGPEDKACHAHRGKTPRNAIMFESGGYWYVYLCYGIHWMLNITTGPKDFPAAVLIRGVGNICGPGRVTKQLQVDHQFMNKICHRKSALWIEKNETVCPPVKYITTPRIGIDYTEKEWRAKPYRFVTTDLN